MQASYRRACAACGAGFASEFRVNPKFRVKWSCLKAIIKEHDMPNRGELAIPARPADFGAKDAWMVISFSAIGWLMSISMAASLAGTLPKLPW
jgi:hypothetical protein